MTEKKSCGSIELPCGGTVFDMCESFQRLEKEVVETVDFVQTAIDAISEEAERLKIENIKLRDAIQNHCIFAHLKKVRLAFREIILDIGFAKVSGDALAHLDEVEKKMVALERWMTSPDVSMEDRYGKN